MTTPYVQIRVKIQIEHIMYSKCIQMEIWIGDAIIFLGMVTQKVHKASV